MQPQSTRVQEPTLLCNQVPPSTELALLPRGKLVLIGQFVGPL